MLYAYIYIFIISTYSNKIRKKPILICFGKKKFDLLIGSYRDLEAKSLVKVNHGFILLLLGLARPTDSGTFFTSSRIYRIYYFLFPYLDARAHRV